MNIFSKKLIVTLSLSASFLFLLESSSVVMADSITHDHRTTVVPRSATPKHKKKKNTLLPLRLYWSSVRGDNFVTATSRGGDDALKAGYNYIRDEGCILSSKQTGTIPLKLYWSSARGDNFIASTNEGRTAARAAKYRFARVEGYIFKHKQPGTIPLGLYWSSARGDNFSTATNRGAKDARAAKYRFVRTQGYVYPASKCRVLRSSDTRPTSISELKIPVSILTSVIKSQLNGIKIHLNNYGPRRETTWYRGGDSYVKLPTSLGGSRYTFDLPSANKIPFRYYINNINLSSFNIGTSGNRFVARFNLEENGIEVKGHCAGKGYKAVVCKLKGSDNTAPDIHMKNMVASVYLTPEVRHGSLSFGSVSTDFTVDIRFGKTCNYLNKIKFGGVCNHIEKKIQNGVKNSVKTAMYNSLNSNSLRDSIATAIRSELSKQGVKKIISAKIEGNMAVIRFRK